MITKLGRKRIKDIIDFINASDLPPGDIDKLKCMFKVAYFAQIMILPPNLEIWRNVTTRCHLYEISSFDERSQISGKEQLEPHPHSTSQR